MKTSNSLISEHILSEGSVLYSTSLGNILIGCPPEVLKVIMIQHLPLPDTIVIPGTLHKFNSSQACLEFPFLHFLFIQQGLARGRKFKVLAKKDVCKRMSEMLRVILIGPELEEAIDVEAKLKIPKNLDKTKVEQIIKETQFLAPKNSKGINYKLSEMVEFIPFEIGKEEVVYSSYQEHPEVSINRTGEDQFALNCDVQLDCRLNITQKQTPVYEIKGVKINKTEMASQSIFTIRCLGASEGFDPTQPANGFLFHFNGKWILWDCPAYLNQHLEKIGLPFEKIDGVFISHVHEDHLDIMETVGWKKKADIYTSPEIFHCMILKLMTILDCSYNKAASFYNFHPVYANKPFDLFGATMEVFYSSHAIPALGMRLNVPHKDKSSKLFFSGDNLAKRMVQKLAEANVYSKARHHEVENFVDDQSNYDLLFVDAGGGPIHGDAEDFADSTQNIIYMHTGKKIPSIPANHCLLKAGQKFIVHK